MFNQNVKCALIIRERSPPSALSERVVVHRGPGVLQRVALDRSPAWGARGRARSRRLNHIGVSQTSSGRLSFGVGHAIRRKRSRRSTARMAVCHRGFCKALTQPLLMAMLQLLLFLLLQLQLGHSRQEASDIGHAAIIMHAPISSHVRRHQPVSRNAVPLALRCHRVRFSGAAEHACASRAPTLSGHPRILYPFPYGCSVQLENIFFFASTRRDARWFRRLGVCPQVHEAAWAFWEDPSHGTGDVLPRHRLRG